MFSFDSMARAIAHASGRPAGFIAAVILVLAWAVCGPRFGFSDTWQLVINTGTTIVTFLMVFLIQNTQDRDTAALQVKLDELLRVTKGARLGLLDLEAMKTAELDEIRRAFVALGREHRDRQGNDI